MLKYFFCFFYLWSNLAFAYPFYYQLELSNEEVVQQPIGLVYEEDRFHCSVYIFSKEHNDLGIPENLSHSQAFFYCINHMIKQLSMSDTTRKNYLQLDISPIKLNEPTENNPLLYSETSFTESENTHSANEQASILGGYNISLTNTLNEKKLLFSTTVSSDCAGLAYISREYINSHCDDSEPEQLENKKVFSFPFKTVLTNMVTTSVKKSRGLAIEQQENIDDLTIDVDLITSSEPKSWRIYSNKEDSTTYIELISLSKASYGHKYLAFLDTKDVTNEWLASGDTQIFTPVFSGTERRKKRKQRKRECGAIQWVKSHPYTAATLGVCGVVILSGGVIAIAAGLGFLAGTAPMLVTTKAPTYNHTNSTPLTSTTHTATIPTTQVPITSTPAETTTPTETTTPIIERYFTAACQKRYEFYLTRFVCCAGENNKPEWKIHEHCLQGKNFQLVTCGEEVGFHPDRILHTCTKESPIGLKTCNPLGNYLNHYTRFLLKGSPAAHPPPKNMADYCQKAVGDARVVWDKDEGLSLSHNPGRPL